MRWEKSIVVVTTCIFFSINLGACQQVGPRAADPTLTPTSTAMLPTPVTVIQRTLTLAITPTLTITPTPSATPNNDPDYFYGGMLITLDSVGQTIEMKRNQTLLLSLGENYVWSVQFVPDQIVSRNMKITPEPGEQGVYITRQVGVTELRAVGEPKCRFDKVPCARPSVLFTVKIVVQ